MEYKCHSTKYDNYKLNGNPEIKCLANGSWTTHNFTCKNVLTGLHPWYNLPTENKTIETGIILLIDQVAAMIFVRQSKVSDFSTSDIFYQFTKLFHKFELLSSRAQW